MREKQAVSNLSNNPTISFSQDLQAASDVDSPSFVRRIESFGVEGGEWGRDGEEVSRPMHFDPRQYLVPIPISVGFLRFGHKQVTNNIHMRELSLRRIYRLSIKPGESSTSSALSCLPSSYPPPRHTLPFPCEYFNPLPLLDIFVSLRYVLHFPEHTFFRLYMYISESFFSRPFTQSISTYST